MAEYIQAVDTVTFPFSRPKDFEKQGKKAFARWLKGGGVNMNDAPMGPPMLSLEDEIMLARLRTLAVPARAHGLYTMPENAGKDFRQYEFGFMGPGHTLPGGSLLDKDI